MLVCLCLLVCLFVCLCICPRSNTHQISDAGEVSVDNSADEDRVKQSTPLAVQPQITLPQTTTILPPQGTTLPIQGTTLLPTTPQPLPIFTNSTALSIQNILNANTPLFYNSDVKKPVVTLVPSPSTSPQPIQEVDVITPLCDIISSPCDIITAPCDVITEPRDVTSPIALPKISLSPETAQPTL